MTMTQAFLAAAALAVATALPAQAADSEAMAAQPATDFAVGQMMHTKSGRPVGAIYRITAKGEPQVVVDGRMVTLPAATLFTWRGQPATSLTITDLRRMARR